MELTVTGEGVGITEDYLAERTKRLKRMFPSEPDIRAHFDLDTDGKIIAEVVVPIRGYRTLKACSKAENAHTALDKAVKKLEWKLRRLLLDDRERAGNFPPALFSTISSAIAPSKATPRDNCPTRCRRARARKVLPQRP
jgi:ribosomal subunit interface protein